MAQLYYVDQQQADDPEGDSHQILTAAEIGRAFPTFATLIVGDGTESLDYCHELWRVRIVAAGEETCDNCALPEWQQRTVLSDSDEIRCADCGTTLRVIDG